MIKDLLFVGIGGGMGSVLRYLCAWIIPHKSFPTATFTVNIAGSFLIGMIMALSIKGSLPESQWKLFLTTGICGGFTTFSSLSMENLQLIQQDKWAVFFLYAFGSLLLGIAAAALGFKIINH